ncbi:type II toxin-antitoxin system VapC family toxin [Phytohabitans suffuscus]|uniref:Ribonuclease VapC n=1 Tax=Phytohabitans suffuscus TaxID=624315 RepID=A0A6F8YL55_9ACTN|nr:type II toxin-antitoxin system VapC family toxin [Phytohabitans suffuscus]BCB86807.1 ribonuclease VapC [Phytohabitans suffuscus]
MGFLLDTNVVSELRKARPDPNVLAWHARNANADVFISVLVVGEIRRGIEGIRNRDPRQADALDAWLTGLVATYRDRVLPVTAEVSDEWGRLAIAQPPPVIDGLMAATARVHQLTLVTRNVADVARTGVRVVNPFEPATA